MMQTMIVDDEPLARSRLQRFLADEPDMEVAWVCQDGLEAVEVLQRESVDVLFLDVQMPGLDGFGVLEAIEECRWPLTVFVTAYVQHAVQAFDVQALAYLVKPFDQATFANVVDRVRKQRALHDEAAFAAHVRALLSTAEKPTYPQRLTVRQGKTMIPLAIEAIDWIEASGNYVTLHIGSTAYLYAATMQHMEQILDPDQFCRVHRSTIVNVARIRTLHPLFRGEYALTLMDGTSLKLTRSYRDKLQVLLGADGF